MTIILEAREPRDTSCTVDRNMDHFESYQTVSTLMGWGGVMFVLNAFDFKMFLYCTQGSERVNRLAPNPSSCRFILKRLSITPNVDIVMNEAEVKLPNKVQPHIPQPEGSPVPALISGFCSMKRLGLFLWDTSPSQVTPSNFSGSPQSNLLVPIYTSG